MLYIVNSVRDTSFILNVGYIMFELLSIILSIKFSMYNSDKLTSFYVTMLLFKAC